MEKALDYSNVYLVPRCSVLESRSQADVSVEFLKRRFKLPVVPANMESVIDAKIAKYLSENDYFYIMHRFNLDIYNFVKTANDESWKLISISVGITTKTLEEVLNPIKWAGLRVDVICIDVANAFNIFIKDKIKWIKDNFPNTKLIVGNVATPDGVSYLSECGADAVKCGISGGSICSTRYQTGFYVPMFSCVQNCTNTTYIDWSKEVPDLIVGKKQVPIIADGSIKNIGDIAKALVAGATFVMAGGLFSPCIDSPAKLKDGKKVYYGSTSIEAKKEKNHIEGHSLLIEPTCTYAEQLEFIKQGLSSSVSYAGGEDLSAFESVEYIRV